MRRILIILFTVIVFATLFVVLCTFVRKPYESVLLDRFGKVIEEKDQSRIAFNWYLKWPTDSVIRIDQRLHLYTSGLEQVVTAGSEPIAVRTFAAWRIVDPMLFYKTTAGSDVTADRILKQKIGGLVNSKIANHQLDQFFNTDINKVKTSDIESEIAREASGENGLKGQGIEVVQVGFARMAFPASIAESVYLRMSADRIRTAIRFQTEGAAQAQTIRGQAEAEAASIRVDAIKESEKLRGEGDAEALSLLAAVQSNERVRSFFNYVKNLELYRSGFTSNTYLVLPTDSDLLENMLNSPKKDPTTPGPTPVSTTQPISKKN